jgi:non-homologous end joining protein Ku
MNELEQIEELLAEANSLGFKKELLERVKRIIDNGSKKYPVDILEEEFQRILNEIID